MVEDPVIFSLPLTDIDGNKHTLREYMQDKKAVLVVNTASK